MSAKVYYTPAQADKSTTITLSKPINALITQTTSYQVSGTEKSINTTR